MLYLFALFVFFVNFEIKIILTMFRVDKLCIEFWGTLDHFALSVFSMRRYIAHNAIWGYSVILIIEATLGQQVLDVGHACFLIYIFEGKIILTMYRIAGASESKLIMNSGWHGDFQLPSAGTKEQRWWWWRRRLKLDIGSNEIPIKNFIFSESIIFRKKTYMFKFFSSLKVWERESNYMKNEKKLMKYTFCKLPISGFKTGKTKIIF